jgi:hypothetical protein
MLCFGCYVSMSAHITENNRALLGLPGRVHVRGYVPFAPSQPLYLVNPHYEVVTGKCVLCTISLALILPLTPVKPPPTTTCSIHQCHTESAWPHLCKKLSCSGLPILCLSRNVSYWRKNEDGKVKVQIYQKHPKVQAFWDMGKIKWIIKTWPAIWMHCINNYLSISENQRL